MDSNNTLFNVVLAAVVAAVTAAGTSYAVLRYAGPEAKVAGAAASPEAAKIQKVMRD